MNNLTILVATEDEKRALIPTEYYDNVFITGIGIINIIKTLKDTKFDGTIINIGYAGATSNIKVGEVCFVNNSYCYRNIYNNLDSIKVNTLEVQGVKCVSCATSMDFVVDSKHTNTLFDMELRDTVEMMNSADYRERFKAEYYQVVVRYQKLKAMLLKWDNGELNFHPTCPRSTYNMQIKAMTDYIAVLEARAVMEGIELE